MTQSIEINLVFGHMLNNKCYHVEVLLKRFHLNGRNTELESQSRDSVGVEGSRSGIKIRVHGYFSSELSLVVAPY